MPNQANLSTKTESVFTRFEKQLSVASIGTIWLGRLLNGSDAGRLVYIRRIARDWLSLKDAEWVLYGAEAYSKVRHPSLVKLLGVLEQGDDLVSVSEHLEGVRLIDLEHSVFDEGVPIPATVAVRLVLDAARATWQAHRLAADVGIFPTERLFLPESVFVTSYGATLLSEIGVLSALAKCVVPRTVPDLLAQMAPEELGARNSQNGSPEVFSLGVVLWELLANRWLFSRESDSRTHQELLLEPIPGLDHVERFGMPVPDAIVSIVRRATERDPTRRFSSVNDLVDALSRLPAHFVASEQQVSEVLRQRVPDMLRECRGDESERALSGTFAELRSTRPSLVPGTSSSHDWDRPTLAQRSLLCQAPAQSEESMLPQRPSAVATPRVSTLVQKPRRRYGSLLLLGLMSIFILGGIAAFVHFGPKPNEFWSKAPAPAGRVDSNRAGAIPAPKNAAPSTRLGSSAAMTQPAPPPATPPQKAETAADAVPVLPSTTTVSTPAPTSSSPRHVPTKRNAWRRSKAAKAAQTGSDNGTAPSGVDPQWGI